MESSSKIKPYVKPALKIIVGLLAILGVSGVLDPALVTEINDVLSSIVGAGGE